MNRRKFAKAAVFLLVFLVTPMLRAQTADSSADTPPEADAEATETKDARVVFEPTWESLNARQSPGWFQDAKFGIFIHWGVYSVPSYCHTSTYSEWYQWWVKTNAHNGLERKFHEENFGKDFLYRDFAPMFKAELWDPNQWAGLFKRAGARYVVLVSKHHDGYTLWPNDLGSKNRGYPWNSAEVGPKRDLCGELADAVREQGLKMGFYYSLMEWENPLYEKDKSQYVERQMIPQIKDLVQRYEPALIWPDGEWNDPDTLWRSPEVLAWLYNNVSNPDEFVVNDRWGKGLRGHSGDYYTTEYGHTPWEKEGASDVTRPFEECRGIGHSFAFNRLENYDLYRTRESLIRLFIDLVSRGGNLLLNLGPTADGRIPVIQQDRLIAMGQWLEVNGESIYGSRASLFKPFPWGRSTTHGNTVYLHVFDWPETGRIEIAGLLTKVDKAYLLHDDQRRPLKLEGNDGAGRLGIDLAGYHPFKHASVIALVCAEKPTVTHRILPDATGRLTLPADRAELKGSSIGLEKKADGITNVGFWSDLDDTIRFPVRIGRDGTYDVRVEYACGHGLAGSQIECSIADQSLSFTVESTENWAIFKTVSVGSLDLVTGDHELTVRAVSMPKGHAMNLRKIELAPK